jgi:hypothetical protein
MPTVSKYPGDEAIGTLERARELANLLRESATVLDEPFHHDAVASVLHEAADALDILAARCGSLTTPRSGNYERAFHQPGPLDTDRENSNG